MREIYATFSGVATNATRVERQKTVSGVEKKRQEKKRRIVCVVTYDECDKKKIEEVRLVSSRVHFMGSIRVGCKC